MSLQILPHEVLEILLLYVDIDVLPIVSNILGFEGSDYFWRKLCKREGYKNTGESSWKTVFNNNFNWITQKFDKREYKIDTGKTCNVEFGHQNNVFSDIFTEHVMYGENLVIQSQYDEISVWNIDKSPVLLFKKSPVEFWESSRKRLFTLYDPDIDVYSNINGTYCKMLNQYIIGGDPSYFFSQFALTDEYFAAVHNRLKIMKVVNIETKEEFIIPLSREHFGDRMSISLLRYYLYVIVREPIHFLLKTYNLQTREWMDDLILVQQGRSCYFSLEVSSNLLVSWGRTLEYDVTGRPKPLIKIWKSNGELIKTMSSEFILSFGIHEPTTDKNIKWLLVEGEYIIFSCLPTIITIWRSTDPDMCKQLDKDDKQYFGQHVISSHLLVLSYSYCFKVVDFKKAAYLYDVQLSNNPLSSVGLPGSCQDYFVNEFFYVSCKEDYNENKPVWIFTIYDFRDQSIQN